LAIGLHFHCSLPKAAEVTTMMQTQPATPNQIQKSLVPMLQTWARCISWTVLLSATLAIVVALVLDGCARIH
jgi:hypothetical protein